MMPATRETPHGRFIIRSLAIRGTVKARAFLGSVAILDGEGASHEAAVEQVRQLLDARRVEAESKRAGGVPSAVEYEDALTALAAHDRIEDGQRRMLRAIFEAPGMTLTATQLARAAGYQGYQTANMKFGMLGYAVGLETGFEPPGHRPGGAVWTKVLATGPSRADLDPGEHHPWTLRHEVATALRGRAAFLLTLTPHAETEARQ
jgi:hypothetical protein